MEKQQTYNFVQFDGKGSGKRGPDKLRSTEDLKRIYDRYLECGTMSIVGKEEGISRERIRQLLRQYKPDFDAIHANPLAIKEKIQKKCQRCGNTFLVVPSAAEHRVFCSKECYSAATKKNPFEKGTDEYDKWDKKRKANRAHAYYHNVLKKRPDFHELIRERNARAWKKRVDGVV